VKVKPPLNLHCWCSVLIIRMYHTRRRQTIDLPPFRVLVCWWYRCSNTCLSRALRQSRFCMSWRRRRGDRLGKRSSSLLTNEVFLATASKTTSVATRDGNLGFGHPQVYLNSIQVFLGAGVESKSHTRVTCWTFEISLI
jgi:hypothetical protein